MYFSSSSHSSHIYKLAYSDPIVLAEFACFCRNLLEYNYKKEKNRSGHHRLLASFFEELFSQDDCSVCVLHRTCLRTDDTATEDKLLGFNFQKPCLHYTPTTSANTYRWQELPLASRLGKVNQLTSEELTRNKSRSEKSNSSLPLIVFQPNHTLKLLSHSQKNILQHAEKKSLLNFAHLT